MTPKRTSTARARLVATLTDEILQNPEPSAFPIASEHQLCRRFNISRVTVRLALSDLENRGLIYRKHGKGTFAHGRNTRVYRNIGLLVRSSQAGDHSPIAEFARGVQNVLSPLQSGILVISASPSEWRAEKASTLAGVIVVPHGVTAEDIQSIKDRNLPCLTLGESDLPGPHISLGQREAARKMTEQLIQLGHRRIAVISGFESDLDGAKRRGVQDALQAAGIDPAQVPEFSTKGVEGVDIYKTVCEVLELRPRPTAVMAFDDTLAAVLSFHARREENLVIPRDMSIVSFHEWPFLNFLEPRLTTVKFEFYTAGQQAAEALTHAAQTGQPMTDLIFPPGYRPGQTVGPVPSEA